VRFFQCGEVCGNNAHTIHDMLPHRSQ